MKTLTEKTRAENNPKKQGNAKIEFLSGNKLLIN